MLHVLWYRHIIFCGYTFESIIWEILNFLFDFLSRTVVFAIWYVHFSAISSLNLAKNVHGHKWISTSIKATRRHVTLNRFGRFSRLFRQIFNPAAGEKAAYLPPSFMTFLEQHGIRRMHERLNATDLRAPLSRFYQFNITRKRSIFFLVWKNIPGRGNVCPLYLFIELFKAASAFIVIAFSFNSTMVHWINYKFNWQGKSNKCICI